MAQQEDDPYAALGVAADASHEDIRKAYRRLALQHHPDKNPSDPEAAQAAFRRVTRAYEAISTPEARAAHAQQQQQAHVGGDPFFADILAGLFGNLAAGGFGAHPVQPPSPLEVPVDVTLEDVVHGATKHVELEAHQVCAACEGRGAARPEDVIRCIQCQGRGSCVRQLAPGMFAQSTCGGCGGRCSAIRTGTACAACGGRGVGVVRQAVAVQCPKGVPSGFRHPLPAGAGGVCPGSRQPRDATLAFRLVLPADLPGVRVQGTDVHVAAQVALEDVLCGRVDLELPALYGSAPDRLVRLRARGYVDPSRPQVFPGLGLPAFGGGHEGAGRGDLHVTLQVVFPADGAKVDKYRDIFCRMFKRPPPAAEDERQHDEGCAQPAPLLLR